MTVTSPDAAAIRSVPIWTRLLVGRASWALIDQGVISLGGFLVNVELARSLPGSDYGAFALFMGAIFVFRAVDFSLVSYPLSLRLCATDHKDQPALMGTTVTIAALLAVLLAVLMHSGASILGRADIALPATVCFLSWQAQETTRRLLCADFRYRAAVWGDAVSFLGQAALIAVLSGLGLLTLQSALYAISIMFLAGAALHVMRVEIGRPNIGELVELFRGYFTVGKWSLLTYEVVLLRTQLFPWILAMIVGTAGTASFQAALNIANLMNPVILGIGSVIPQAVAQARLTEGFAGAWKVARGYILFGLPAILVFCTFILVSPQLALRLIYGAGSPYVDMTLSVQLLVFACACEYLGEMIAKTLLGAELGRLAFLTNATGAVAAFVAVPLIIPFGVLGACMAMAAANVVRLVCAWLILSWQLASEKSVPAGGSHVRAVVQ